jgi:hypothetical protein
MPALRAVPIKRQAALRISARHILLKKLIGGLEAIVIKRPLALCGRLRSVRFSLTINRKDAI